MALNLCRGLILQLAGYKCNLTMALNLCGGLVLQLEGYIYNLKIALTLNRGPFITTGRVKLQFKDGSELM